MWYNEATFRIVSNEQRINERDSTRKKKKNGERQENSLIFLRFHYSVELKKQFQETPSSLSLTAFTHSRELTPLILTTLTRCSFLLLEHKFVRVSCAFKKRRGKQQLNKMQFHWGSCWCKFNAQLSSIFQFHSSVHAFRFQLWKCK